MKRVYHTWEKWECYPAGLYETLPPDGITPAQATAKYAEFLKDSPRFVAALVRVRSEWVRSCEHYLSNEKMNRIAWLGQAAMCVDTRIPSGYRGGFNQLSQAEQEIANGHALDCLNAWLEERGEPKVDMAGAGVNEKVNIY